MELKSNICTKPVSTFNLVMNAIKRFMTGKSVTFCHREKHTASSAKSLLSLTVLRAAAAGDVATELPRSA